MSKKIDLTWRVFGRLTVISAASPRTQPNGQRVSYWFCECECGVRTETRTSRLRNGEARSCGCLHKEVFSAIRTTHGRSKTPEYNIWNLMRFRCESPKNSAYKNYGARGISVCERWRNFENFYADVGPRPSANHSLDRIDNDGDYRPGNVRWATSKVQGRNTRRNHIVTVRGETMPLVEAVERYGGVYGTVKWRLYQGKSIEQALGLTTV